MNFLMAAIGHHTDLMKLPEHSRRRWPGATCYYEQQNNMSDGRNIIILNFNHVFGLFRGKTFKERTEIYRIVCNHSV
jgi:hypothetical protein